MEMIEVTPHTEVSIRNLLFATDFSPASESALPYAVAIRRHYGSQLHALHVVPEVRLVVPPDFMDAETAWLLYQEESTQAQEKLEKLAVRFPELQHHLHLAKGKMWGVIQDLILGNEVNLLVLGTHGRTGLGKVLVGSVAEEILRRASCPVLTVGPAAADRARAVADRLTASSEAPPVFRHILFATDFTLQSLAALPLALCLAQDFGSRITFAHILEFYGKDLHSRPGPIERAFQRLEGLSSPESGLLWSPRCVVEFGMPAVRILEIASDNKVDLIVLGVRSASDHPAAETHLPWSVAHEIIAHAPCPVLTVRGQTDAFRPSETPSF
jgi:nucleotide-binding universal stress UspA family protein